MIDLQEQIHFHKKWLNGERDGVKAQIKNLSLREISLSNCDLRCAYIENVDFEGSYLTNVDLSNSILKGVNFSRSTFVDTCLTCSKIERAKFCYSLLEMAELNSASLLFVDASHSNFKKSNFSYTSLYHTSFSHSNLSESNFSKASINQVSFYQAFLSSSIFDDTRFLESSFVGTDLEDAKTDFAVNFPMFCNERHGISGKLIQIGETKKSAEEWEKFLAEDNFRFFSRNKKQLEAVLKAYIAYMKELGFYTVVSPPKTRKRNHRNEQSDRLEIDWSEYNDNLDMDQQDIGFWNQF